MQEEPFYFTPRRSEVLRPIFRLLFDLRFVISPKSPLGFKPAQCSRPLYEKRPANVNTLPSAVFPKLA